MKAQVKRYEWSDLTWKETKQGVFTSHMSLFPAEYLVVEEGWEIDGPVRVTFHWVPERKTTRARYRPLRKSEFNLDNPLEYPCASCGAARLSPCVGDLATCTWRVFYLGGGKL